MAVRAPSAPAGATSVPLAVLPAGLLGVPPPGIEAGIAASAILLGLAVMSEPRPPLAAAVALVGILGIFHGHAHGTELPPGPSALLYSMASSPQAGACTASASASASSTAGHGGSGCSARPGRPGPGCSSCGAPSRERPRGSDGEKGAEQEDVRLGMTAALSLSRHQSIEPNGSTGAYNPTDTAFWAVGIAWQYRWGGGL